MWCILHVFITLGMYNFSITCMPCRKASKRVEHETALSKLGRCCALLLYWGRSQHRGILTCDRAKVAHFMLSHSAIKVWLEKMGVLQYSETLRAKMASWGQSQTRSILNLFCIGSQDQAGVRLPENWGYTSLTYIILPSRLRGRKHQPSSCYLDFLISCFSGSWSSFNTFHV